ncbi:MAG TPA: hypothetical protein VG943_01915 [Caulobacterales bacterium]|nr:hypothetical protein [Caulobacterales bacterium]
MGFKFNTDLLTDEGDRAMAAKAYPHVFFALDFPELRDVFLPIDAHANATKSHSRRLGVTAVCLVALALVTAAATPLHHQAPEPWPRIFVLVGAAAGIIGGGIGAFGIWFSQIKTEWLEQRYLAERLRQLHFQILVALAPDILKAADSGETDAFLKARGVALERFKQHQIAPVASKLGEMIKDECGEERVLVKPSETPLPAASPHLHELMQALEDLRMTHQLNYAEIKLSPENLSLWASPVKQVAVFSGVAFWAVATILLLDIAALVGALGPEELRGWIDVAALWLAIVALATRALEEGFQSRREKERYRQYGSNLRLVRRRFREAKDPSEKLRALQEMEEIAHEDLANFLKGNDEARFVM